MEPLTANDPRTVGEFALRARLGAGGMGRVYLGFSPAGRAVAIKVVHPELARDPEFVARFGREVANARAVSGMYTAPVVASGVDDSPPWLATAYVPGPSLAEIVSKNGPLSEPAVWRLAAGLAEALRAVHGSGLVHRDLKPANVLLAADGPHVIDFGISRAFEGTQLTSAGVVVGTPGYMSPEQAEGHPAGPLSDVFSLGCVLAYAATGNAPFGSGSAASVLYRVVNAEPDLSGVAPQLRQAIESCLRKNFSERTALAQFSAAVSAFGPAVPVALGSFWPEPLNSVILASQAYPDAGPGSAASSPMTPPVSPVPGSYIPTAAATHAQPQAPGYLGSQQASWPAQSPSSAPSSPATPWPQPASAAPWPQWSSPLPEYSPGRRRPMRSEVPSAVLGAIWLMYLAAATTLVNLFSGGGVETRDSRYYNAHRFTIAGHDAHTTAVNVALTTFIGGIIGIVCWIWFAMACRRGRGWVTIGATALLALHTVGVITVLFATRGDPTVKILSAVTWIFAAGAVITLWGRQARDFFDAWRAR